MAKKLDVIKRAISSLDEAWSHDSEGWCHDIEDIENFLKSVIKQLRTDIEVQRGTKVGSVAQASGEDGLVYIRFFADDDSQEKWETDPNANAKLLLGQFSFKVSDAGGDEYTLATRITKLPTSPAVKGSANTLAFSYNSYYGGDPTNLDTEDGTATVSVNGTEIGALEQTLRPGNSYTMDLGPYLTAERNTVTLTVMNAHGKRRTFSVAVQIVEISIAFGANFDESAARGSDWELPVQCNGVEAQVNVLIDGTEAYSSSAHNSSVTFRIDSDNKLNAGAHKLEV